VFRVVLPTGATEEGADAPRPARAFASGPRGRVLCVDDKPLVLAGFRRAFGTEHEVVTMSRALDVLAVVSGQQRFDVIVSDLMMPDSGMDLYTAIAAVAPEQAERMIFMTGGAFTPAAREFLDRVSNPRLEKPFDANVLRNRCTKTRSSRALRCGACSGA
jgi:CheY-like chemotaxis protein